MQTDGSIRRKHAVRHSHEQRIAKPVPQSSQCVTDGRLGEAETFSRRCEATKIPDSEEDAQKVEVEMFIISVHATNSNYEFDVAPSADDRQSQEF